MENYKNIHSCQCFLSFQDLLYFWLVRNMHTAHTSKHQYEKGNNQNKSHEWKRSYWIHFQFCSRNMVWTVTTGTPCNITQFNKMAKINRKILIKKSKHVFFKIVLYYITMCHNFFHLFCSPFESQLSVWADCVLTGLHWRHLWETLMRHWPLWQLFLFFLL